MASNLGDHVNVQTVGICTYFAPGAPGMPDTHRVVLVNASDPSRFPQSFRDRGVGAHVATMQILETDLAGELPESRDWLPIVHRGDGYVVWKLSGISLTIGNAVATRASATDTCIPHLRLYSAEGQLPPPGPAALGTDRELTACVFDHPPSVLQGKTLPPGGAAVGVLTILTSGTPVIVARPFGSTETVSFEVGAGAGITLANIPADSSIDKDADFLLHFLTLDAVPAGAQFPLEPFVCAPLDSSNLPLHIRIGELTVPGCSNSNYP
jgi:hypothetical protein